MGHVVITLEPGGIAHAVYVSHDCNKSGWVIQKKNFDPLKKKIISQKKY